MNQAALQVSTIELPSPRGERETMELLRGERDQKREKAEMSEKWEEVERAAKIAERRSNAAESQRYSMLPAELEGNTNFDWDEPPAYENSFGNNQRSVHTSVLDNGRISMFFNGRGRDFTTLPPLPQYEPREEQMKNFAARSFPLLNIVIQVVGSRGDVQPFVALGQELKTVGHRVRLATHGVFESFVRDAGLEFFSIGGDPADLMAYMVKNPGIIPKFQTIRAGDISRKRKMICEMLEGCWRSCIQPDASTGVPFVAEAIIANPPSFAYLHCAQALGIPCHVMFTMPWSATRAFPHPLANVQLTDTDPNLTNFLSYGLVDMMTWQGLGDVINHWRKTSLNLEPLSSMVGANMANILKVPFTYCWSPALIPKPFDWPSHIDVCGFFFRSAPQYTPFPELHDFLSAGPPPIYIGFGSIVMEDAHEMTRIILDSVRECGIRAIVSEGWSKLGEGVSHHDDILFIGDCPHEWLFKHVSAVVHHGGAGTTACGLLNGRPTAIVPFFGDQPFWAKMVHAAGAGPKPIDHKSLSVEKLCQAIDVLLAPETVIAAERIAAKMRSEDGVKEAVKSFHRNLPFKNMNCDLISRQPATWCWKKGKRTLKLSHRAASILVEHKKIEVTALKIWKPKPITLENKRWDPISGTTSAFFDGAVNVGSSFGDAFTDPVKEYRRAKTFEREQKALNEKASTRASSEGSSGSRAPSESSFSQRATSNYAPSERDTNTSTVSELDGQSRTRPGFDSMYDSTTIDGRRSNSSTIREGSVYGSETDTMRQPSIYESENGSRRHASIYGTRSNTASISEHSDMPIAINRRPVETSGQLTSVDDSANTRSIVRSTSAMSLATTSRAGGSSISRASTGLTNLTAGSSMSKKSTTPTEAHVGLSAGEAARHAVGKGAAKVGFAIAKGTIDLPLAVADGFQNLPSLYGEKVRDYGEVRGWKSGGKNGLKSLGYGFYDGYVGFFTQPYKGARDGGPLGLMKGITKGCAGLLTQPAHGIFGVVAYPALGLYRSLNTQALTGAQGEILQSQRDLGMWLAQNIIGEKGETERVLRRFEDEWLRVREPGS